jgi:hypothetical protein
VLGLAGDELYLELFEILAERRYGDVFRFVQRVLDEGYDLSEFYRGLADSLRTLLIVSFDGAEALDVREDLRSAFAATAARFAPGDLLRMLTLVAELDSEGRLRKSTNPRTLLEAMLLRFAYLDRTVDLESLLSNEGVSAPAEQPRDLPAGNTRGTTPATRSRGKASTEGKSSPPPENSATPVPGNVGDAQAALLGLLGEHRLPRGLGILLKVASVAEESDDRVTLEVPPGPGLERLADPAARKTLEQALGERLGHDITLVVRGVGERQDESAVRPARLTPEKVRADKLARLTRDQPTLDRAVREWDLELFE